MPMSLLFCPFEPSYFFSSTLSSFAVLTSFFFFSLFVPPLYFSADLLTCLLTLALTQQSLVCLIDLQHESK